MTLVLSITQAQIFQVLGDFLASVLPATCKVVRGEANRVPEPQGSNFVVMWPMLRERLSTNVDTENDIAFIGSISGTTLTVTQMLVGTLINNLLLGANGILANTTIVTQLTGTTGGAGTYQVSLAQTLGSTTIQAGYKSALQPVKVSMQVDVHGPSSADNAHIISTLLRDEYSVTAFGTLDSSIDVQPLYCEEPRQVPFTNGEQAVEERWIIQIYLQVNSAVAVPQQFSSTVTVPIISASDNYHA